MDPRYQCLAVGAQWTWRLLGSNNRALARAAEGFTSLEAAAADALAVAALAADGDIDLTTDRGVTWRWSLTHAGRARAVSAVPYARRLECVRAIARFRECAPGARVSEVPLVRRPVSGRADRGAAESLRDRTRGLRDR